MIVFVALNRLSTIYLYIFASLCVFSYSEDASGRPGNVSDVADKPDVATYGNSSETVEGGVKEVGGGATELSAIESSFEDTLGPTEFAFAEVTSQNSGVSNEFLDTGQPSVFTLSEAAVTELRGRAEIASEPSQNATPNLNANATTDSTEAAEEKGDSRNVRTSEESRNVTSTPETDRSEEAERKKVVETTTETPSVSQNLTETNEEIPSFSEWAQRQLEQAEKKKEIVNSSVHSNGVNGKGTGNLKVRSKNYASLDCGAKIVAANPEAVSASAVLSSSRDEYKLNACQNRIWFIVELCEAIQAKKIDLANFELFSSSPKDFSVSVSDRFPTRDWINVGHFTAKDERDVQSFDLNPQMFGKFIKLEMHSHHGSEHYCPISLFRVYGTSEFEVLEKESQAHVSLDDDEDDETLDSDNGQEAKNLFSSATDAVISIVKKAAEVLGNKQNTSNYTIEEVYTDSPKLVNSCTTPSHLIVCDNCSDVLFGEVFELISCKASNLYDLIQNNLIKNTIYHTYACVEFGLDFRSKRHVKSHYYNQFVLSVFTKGYIAALCNTAAVLENKVVLNISKQFPNITKEIPKELEVHEKKTSNLILNKTQELQPTEQLNSEKIQLETSIPIEGNISDTSQIKPTKTLTPDNNINTHSTPEVKEEKTIQPIEQLQVNSSQSETQDVEYLAEIEVTTESSEDIDILNELNHINGGSNINSSPTPSTTPQVKESVFLRLSNRIKALERNMSLSSQYLEELSRRYKKQVEEMQRLLDKTLASLNEESKKHDEHNKKLEEKISELSAMVFKLVEEKNNWVRTVLYGTIFLTIFFIIFAFRWRSEPKPSPEPNPNVPIRRRQSIAVVNHTIPPKKVRRPSEEALKISGSYKDLLRNENVKKKIKDRKRKKKKPMSRSNSFDALPEEVQDEASESRPVSSDPSVFRRLESAPGGIVGIDLYRKAVEDVPIVLDECDNSPLENLPIDSPSYIRTASEVRLSRNGSLVNGNHEVNSLSSEASSTVGPSEDFAKGPSPKKDRKGAFRRMLKKVF